MKRMPVLLLLISQILFYTSVYTQVNKWQQQADFRISVSLNTKDHTLQGNEQITYTNNSSDTLHFIWMHCWPNAYRNDKTAFSEQLLKNNRTDFYFSQEAKKGYINQLQFTVDGIIAVTEDHPIHQDIIRLLLPHPLLPGQSSRINTPFHVKLPDIFSRMGFHNGFYAITQWYPKPAVYDQEGWHPMPYLDQGEFYSEFGKYEVAITVPEDVVLAATGYATDSIMHQTGLNGKPVKTIVYIQENIHDFAWFAAKDYVVIADTMHRENGSPIRIHSYFARSDRELWQNSIQYVKSAIRFRSEVIGEYPYDDVQIVDGYQGEGSGGMEYPTITVINKIKDPKELELTIAHEIGHNWMYGALGSNERMHPWLDEGLNTYYDRRYEKQLSGSQAKGQGFLSKRSPEDIETWLVSGLESIHRDQPINSSSESFSGANYGLVGYYKTAAWFEDLAESLGQPLFDSCIKSYYKRYRFSHVHPGDIQKVFEETCGHRIPQFDQLGKTGPLKPAPAKKLHLAFLYDFSKPAQFHTIGFGPLPGYNKYDGFMIGGFIHNYQLPLSHFRFFIAPLYGTASKSLAGLANLSYTIYPSGKFQQVDFGLNAARFTGDEFTVNDATERFQYQKLSPYLKLTVRENNLQSKRERYIQVKSFFIHEDESGKSMVGRNLHQVKMYYADHRILYPYEIDAIMEVNKSFTRLALTGKYYFNYADRKGGLQLRFFAGKFLYNGSRTLLKTLENDRYLLNLTGADGYEDYTYSNYFIGRNEFKGWMSQQIMMRDGGFKVRTALNSNKVGKTDNWLTAINLTSSIPDRYNPLSLLPVKIPLKIFADIGSFAEAWKEDFEGGRILFDAGVQFSLFRETVNIYIPILNSQVFRNYNQSTLGEKRFWKTISFSIDIQQFSARKLMVKAGL